MVASMSAARIRLHFAANESDSSVGDSLKSREPAEQAALPVPKEDA